MMKKLLFTLMLLLTAVFTIAAQQIPLPEIVVTPSEDSYTFTVIDQGEFQITCSYYDFETGEYGPEEEIQFPLTIYRTERPKQLYIKAFQAVGEYEFHTFTEYHFIAPLGDEIPPAPEITVTKEDNGWNGFHYVVSAVGDGNVIFSRKLSDGSWERATDSDSEGHPCFILSPEINIDLLYQFKAYQESEFKQFYLDDEHTCYYTVRSPETRWEYVVPGIKFLNGDIIFQMAGEGLLSVTYTGNEDVTISVTLNDNPVELVDGMVHLVPGYNIIHAIVSAEGYINSPLEGWSEIRWIAPTPQPQIVVTPGDQAYTIEAIGEGEVHLRCYHECEYHHLNGDVENPVTISRTQFDEFFNFEATARLGENYEEAIVSQDVWVPALGATPMPDIVFTEDETGCEVRAVGQGEVHLFLGGRYHGQEVENPYRIPRPYQQDYYSFEAYAQAEGQWESEVAWETIEVTPLPWIISNETSPSVYFEEIDNVDYEITAGGTGTVRLFMNGIEVDNPYTVQTLLIDDICKFTATAKEPGKLTGDSYDPIEIKPGPKREHLVTITSDNDFYYVTATGDGYITLETYNDNYYQYGDYNYHHSAEGEGTVSVAIPREGFSQWTYVAKRLNVDDGDILGFDVGSFMVVFKELTTTSPVIYSWPSNDQYKIVARPHFIFHFDSGDHTQIQYGTQLMLDGTVVEEPYYIDREEHDKYYHFSAVTTLRYERYEYLGIINGVRYYSSEPLETIEVFSDVVHATIKVRAGGDNFYFDYEDHVWDEDTGEETRLLRYEVNVRKRTSGESSDNYYAHHAAVKDNHDYSGIAIVPDRVEIEYNDMHDPEPDYYYYGFWGDVIYEFKALNWPGVSGWGRDGVYFREFCPVTAIADDAFLGNSALTGVEIGKNVTSIGKDAFKGCSDLTDVTCFATTPPAMTNVETFDEACYSNATLRVPESSVDKYKNADWWRKFRHIEGVAVPGLPGDVNGDGELGIADINTLIDAILMSNTQSIYDINGDGEITISDVMALIDMYLSMD